MIIVWFIGIALMFIWTVSASLKDRTDKSKKSTSMRAYYNSPALGGGGQAQTTTPVQVNMPAKSIIATNLTKSTYVESVPDDVRRLIASEMRELEHFTRSGVKSASDFVRPLAQTRTRAWLDAANGGLADGQFLIGVCHREGIGTLTNATAAVHCFRKAAEQGHARAQNLLGDCYSAGNGVEKNPAEAVRWYKKAAEQGYAIAQYKLSGCYEFGVCIEKNPAEGVRWHKKAAEQGHAVAQYDLGLRYFNGDGVEENSAEAFRWYKKAAEQGYDRAQFMLGGCYTKGVGVEENPTEAFCWYKKAAEQGHDEAQFILGVAYGAGDGIEKNAAEAVRWWKKAAEQGNATASSLNVLGLGYESGIGVVKNDVEACTYCLLANALSPTGDSLNNLQRIRARLSSAQYGAAQQAAIKWWDKFPASHLGRISFPRVILDE